MDLITGTTTYEGFGDVDFVVEAVPEKMEIKQSVFRELDAATPGHAILASNTSSLSITEIGDDAARRQGRRLPLLLPGLGDAAGRGHRRRGHLAGDGHRRLQLRPGDQEAADRLRRGARLRRQQNPDGDDRRDLARPGGAGPLPEAIDQAIAAAKARRWGRSSSPTCSGSTPSARRRAPHESYGETFYVHKGLQQLVADGKLGAKSGGEGFFKDGEQNIPGDGDPDAEELVAMFTCRAWSRPACWSRKASARSATSTSG